MSNLPTSWSPAPAELRLRDDEILIWRASLDCDPRAVECFEASLSSDETARAKTFHFLKDRQSFIVARGILRYLLGRYLHVAPAKIRFQYGEHGRPSLTESDANEAIAFNLSHTENLAVYAFCLGPRIGVDVERVRVDCQPEELAHHYFSKAEQTELASIADTQKIESFFRGWTCKEAYLKARGEGLQTDPGSFGVTLSADLAPRFTHGVTPNWKLASFLAAADCPAAVVYDGVECAVRYFDYGIPPS